MKVYLESVHPIKGNNCGRVSYSFGANNSEAFLEKIEQVKYV